MNNEANKFLNNIFLYFEFVYWPITVEARIDRELTVLLSPLILTPLLTILDSEKFNRF